VETVNGMRVGAARILVVDDEESVLQIFVDLFETTGHEVVTARDGEEAISLLAAGTFDLVITDIHLPKQDGLAVLKAARERDPDVAVVVITGFASTSTAIDALRAGAYDYITKPFDLWEASQIIERGIEHKRLAVENRRLLADLSAANEELRRHEETLRDKVATATRRMATLYEIGKEITASLDYRRTLPLVLEKAVAIADARAGLLFLRDPETGEFACEVAHGVADGRIVAALRFTEGTGLFGEACRDRAPAARDGAAAAGDPLLGLLDATNALAVPLVFGERVIGAVGVVDRDGGFQQEHADVLSLFAAQAANAITNAQAYQKARELDRLKSEFVAIVSHELRTPLTSIKGSLEILTDSDYFQLPEESKSLLDICRENSDRLAFLIDDILDFSKLESSRLSSHFTSVDPATVVRNAIGQIDSLAQRAKIPIASDIGPPVAPVIADEQRVTQVIVNLLSNAVKFSSAGQPVVVRARPAPEGGVVISVEDCGQGIGPADQAKLFQRFRQIDSSSTRRVGGTGLGLVISKGIVEEHGGRIWVESELGKGSVFSFWLPARAACLAAPSEEDADPALSDGTEGAPPFSRAA
jgi:signal transduction histidine kinase